MSVQSWKREFYPIPAIKIKTVEGALISAMNKFEGALSKNLHKHSVRLIYGAIANLDPRLTCAVFEFDDSSCALCYLFASGSYNLVCHRPSCYGCPLTGSTNCHNTRSPFKIFINGGNPRPMLKVLRKALRELRKALRELRRKAGKRSSN